MGAATRSRVCVTAQVVDDLSGDTDRPAATFDGPSQAVRCALAIAHGAEATGSDITFDEYDPVELRGVTGAWTLHSARRDPVSPRHDG